MARIYSTRLQYAHDASPTAPLVYTAPAGFVVVVRGIDAYYGGVLGETMIAIVTIGAVDVVMWQDSVALGEQGWRQYRGRYVLEAADTITAYGGNGSDMSLWGYVLGP